MKYFQFMLFAYYIDDDNYKLVYKANNNSNYPIPATIKEIHKPNIFRTADLVSIESLYFYFGKENKLRYRRVEHSYIPELIEEIRKQDEKYFSSKQLF